MINEYGRVLIVNEAPRRRGVTFRGFSNCGEREGLSTDSDIQDA